jgi:LemA protein
MNVAGFILAGLATVISIGTALLYNRLVSIERAASKAWSTIDVLLKQRHDELPKLVEACKQSMEHERETLEKIMHARACVSQARESTDLQALGAAESRLRRGLLQLYAVAESYPDLEANQSFQNLKARITGLENAIADRREFYNESVNHNNIRLEQFPDVIVARLFHFKPFGLLDFAQAEKPDAKLRTLFG